MGQQSTFNDSDAETIYQCLAEGKSLLSICEAMGLAYSTARQWELDHPEHAAKSARARELGCHFLAEQCLQIADTPVEGVETTEKPDGSIEVKRGDMLQHRKLQIDTRMRLIGKWAPKIYGDKLAVGGAEDLPPVKHDHNVTMTPEEAYKRMLSGG
ncbi:MAG TPA: terminase [Roseateles sp.]